MSTIRERRSYEEQAARIGLTLQSRHQPHWPGAHTPIATAIFLDRAVSQGPTLRVLREERKLQSPLSPNHTGVTGRTIRAPVARKGTEGGSSRPFRINVSQGGKPFKYTAKTG